MLVNYYRRWKQLLTDILILKVNSLLTGNKILKVYSYNKSDIGSKCLEKLDRIKNGYRGSVGASKSSQKSDIARKCVNRITDISWIHLQ